MRFFIEGNLKDEHLAWMDITGMACLFIRLIHFWECMTELKCHSFTHDPFSIYSVYQGFRLTFQ